MACKPVHSVPGQDVSSLPVLSAPTALSCRERLAVEIISLPNLNERYVAGPVRTRDPLLISPGSPALKKCQNACVFQSWLLLFVCSGLTSLSTFFQSYHDGVWLRQGPQC